MSKLTLDELLSMPGTLCLGLRLDPQQTTPGSPESCYVGTPQVPLRPLLLVVHEGEGDVLGTWAGVWPWRMTGYPMRVPLSAFNPATWAGNVEAFTQAMIAPKEEGGRDRLNPGVPFILRVRTDKPEGVRATVLCVRT